MTERAARWYAIVLTLAAVAGCTAKSSPLVTPGSYWRAVTPYAPNIEFASDGTGKMTYRLDAAYKPVAFAWQTIKPNTIDIQLNTNRFRPATPTVQFQVGTGGAPQYGTTNNGAAILLSWDPVPGADFYTIKKVIPGGLPIIAIFASAIDWTPSDYVTGTTFVDNGTGWFYNEMGQQEGCTKCGPVLPNYDGTNTYIVTATQNWLDSQQAKVTVTISGFPPPTSTPSVCSCSLPLPLAPWTNWDVVAGDPTGFTNIVLDNPTTPTSMTADVLDLGGPHTWKYTLAAGSF